MQQLPTLALILAFALALPLFGGCTWLERHNPFAPEPTIDPCDPTASTRYKGTYYIHSDLVRDDGSIDIGRHHKAMEPQSSPCDPLHQRHQQQSDDPARLP